MSWSEVQRRVGACRRHGSVLFSAGIYTCSLSDLIHSTVSRVFSSTAEEALLVAAGHDLAEQRTAVAAALILPESQCVHLFGRGEAFLQGSDLPGEAWSSNTPDLMGELVSFIHCASSRATISGLSVSAPASVVALRITSPPAAPAAAPGGAAAAVANNVNEGAAPADAPLVAAEGGGAGAAAAAAAAGAGAGRRILIHACFLLSGPPEFILVEDEDESVFTTALVISGLASTPRISGCRIRGGIGVEFSMRAGGVLDRCDLTGPLPSTGGHVTNACLCIDGAGTCPTVLSCNFGNCLYGAIVGPGVNRSWALGADNVINSEEVDVRDLRLQHPDVEGGGNGDDDDELEADEIGMDLDAAAAAAAVAAVVAAAAAAAAAGAADDLFLADVAAMAEAADADNQAAPPLPAAEHAIHPAALNPAPVVAPAAAVQNLAAAAGPGAAAAVAVPAAAVVVAAAAAAQPPGPLLQQQHAGAGGGGGGGGGVIDLTGDSDDDSAPVRPAKKAQKKITQFFQLLQVDSESDSDSVGSGDFDGFDSVSDSDHDLI